MKISYLFIFELIILIISILTICLSNIDKNSKVGISLLSFGMFLILIFLLNSHIGKLITKVKKILVSLNLSETFAISLAVTFLLATIILPFVMISGSKPLLIALYNGTFSKLLAFTITLVIYILPVIFLIVSILYNAKIKDLTIIFATLSFLGVVIANGKKVYTWIKTRIQKKFFI